MNDKLFLYYIMEQDGRTARIVNDVVQYLGQPAALPQTPSAWFDIAIIWERNMNRYGNVRNLSLPLGFVLDGAQILRDGLYRSNIDRKLYLLIQRRVTEIDALFFRTFYKYLYKGELDFSTMKDEQGEPKVTINIQEGGVQKLWDANDTTEYFIPFDEDAVNLYMDGVIFDRSAKFVAYGEVDNAINTNTHALPVVFVNAEGTGQGIAFFSQQLEDIPLSVVAYVDDSGNYSIINSGTVPVTFNYTGAFPFECIQSDVNAAYRIIMVKQDGVEITAYDTLAAMVAGTVYPGTINQAITLAPGERVFFLGRFYGFFTGVGVAISFLESGSVTATFTSRAAATTVKAFKPYDLYRKLAEKLGILSVSSVILQACTYLVTSGDGLRGITAAGVKTTMAAFWKSYNIYLKAGIAVQNQVLVFESRDQFFTTGSSTDLGPAQNFTITPAKDLMFSSIKVGHREQSIDDVNGKFDFNGYQIYTSPITRDTKQIDLQSDYKAGPYEIEITRINNDGKTTTDANTDNDVYVIDGKEEPLIQTVLVSFIASGNYIVFPLSPVIVPGQMFRVTGSVSNDGVYTVTDVITSTVQQVSTDITITVSEAAVSVTIEFLSGGVWILRRDIVVTSGVPSPSTIFNVALSPHRLLLLHGPWLRGALSGYEPGKLIFQTGNRNNDLVAGGITDNADVPINTLGAAMFAPWYFELETQVPVSLSDTLDTTPDKDFSGTWGNEAFEGFLIHAGLAPNTQAEQEYKLLAAPGTDITKFIKLPPNGQD